MQRKGSAVWKGGLKDGNGQVSTGSGGLAALHSAALLKGGDGRAVQNQHLIEPHIGSLRRYARALVRDADRADDLVHDCLERALSRWHLWRGEGNLRAEAIQG